MNYRLLSWLLVAAASVVLAQASSPSSTSSAPATTHTVSVGADVHKFTPNTVVAQPGDTISFLFYPANHSVARADFTQPCIPYEVSGVGRVGFWSGFHPMNVVSTNPPTFNLLINDTSPIFFYCSAPTACEDGMVGAINPNSTQTFATQLAYARNATMEFSPGEGFPPEVSATTVRPTSTSTSSSSTSTATQTPTQTVTPVPVASSSSKISTGAIAGIAIGGAAVILMAGTLVYLCGRNKTMGEILKQSQPAHSIPPPSYLGGHMSMTSNSTYPSKVPHIEVDPLQIHRFSGQGDILNRSGAETESYRSRSPPIDENGIPNMMFHVNGRESPARAGSPLMRRPVPLSPQGQVTPVTPGEDPYNQGMDVPAGLRLNRGSSQRGPHELPVHDEPNYTPYKSPEVNNEARFSGYSDNPR